MAAVEERKLKSGETRWRVRYRDPGDPNPRAVVCKTKADANAVKKLVEAWFVTKPGCPYPRAGEDVTAPLMVKTVAADYLDRHVARICEQSSRVRYAQRLDQFLQFVGPRITFDVLVASDLELWDCDMIGRGLSAGYRTALLGAVLGMWSWAASRPREYPGVPPVPVLARPKVQKTKVVAAQFGEIDAMISYLQPGRGPYRYAWLLRCTGLRVDQVESLTPGDLDLERGELLVQTGKTPEEKAHPRTIPLAPVLLEELAKWDLSHPRLALCNQNVARAGIREGWRKAHIAGQVRLSVFAATTQNRRRHGCPSHAARKRFISRLRAAEVDPDVRDWLVGHALPRLAEAYADVEEALAPLARAAVADLPRYNPNPRPSPTPNGVAPDNVEDMGPSNVVAFRR